MRSSIAVVIEPGSFEGWNLQDQLSLLVVVPKTTAFLLFYATSPRLSVVEAMLRDAGFVHHAGSPDPCLDVYLPDTSLIFIILR